MVKRAQTRKIYMFKIDMIILFRVDFKSYYKTKLWDNIEEDLSLQAMESKRKVNFPL